MLHETAARNLVRLNFFAVSMPVAFCIMKTDIPSGCWKGNCGQRLISKDRRLALGVL